MAGDINAVSESETVSPGDNRLVGGCADVACDIIRADRLHPPNKLFKEKYIMTDKLTSLRQYTTVVADTGTSRQ